MATIRFMGGRGVLELHDEILYNQGGLVRRWASGMARTLTRNTKAEAPVNKRPNKTRWAIENQGPVGTLRNSISSSVSRIGPRTLDIETTSGANYSIYVIKKTKTQWARNKLGQFAGPGGTGSNKGGFPLPPNPGFGSFRRVQRISGYDGNNFLARGLERTAVKHESLRPAARSLRRFSD